MSIRIFGASDDLVEIDGYVREEIDAIGEPVTIEVGDEAHGGVSVLVNHTAEHGWAICCTQMLDASDYEPCPIPWPVTLRTKTDDDPDWYPDYSPILEIDCGEDERVEVV